MRTTSAGPSPCTSSSNFLPYTCVFADRVVTWRRRVVDAAGVVWQRTSIGEGTATVTIYTMLFATVLAAVKLLQPAPLASVEPGSPVTAKPVGAVEVTTAASYTG